MKNLIHNVFNETNRDFHYVLRNKMVLAIFIFSAIISSISTIIDEVFGLNSLKSNIYLIFVILVSLYIFIVQIRSIYNIKSGIEENIFQISLSRYFKLLINSLKVIGIFEYSYNSSCII